MPDIILPGPAGRIEARYQRQKAPGAPMALVLHPHPQFGGTMNNPLVYDLFHMFHRLGCTTVRFNFRGVGRSQGTFDSGAGELSDAAADSRLDEHALSQSVFRLGVRHFLRRLDRHAASDAQARDHRLRLHRAARQHVRFRVPRALPGLGLIVHGTKDQVVPEPDVQKLVDRLTAQKGIKITYEKIDGANHFFDKHEAEVV